MSITAGEVLGFKQPTVGETVRLPVMLLDTSGDPVTGEAFDATGVTIEYAKEGDSSFTTFPTFATDNWDEVGYGLYEVILRQSDATELALLDTEGHFKLYVKTDNTRGDVSLFKVNPSDVGREGADGDTLETLSDQLDALNDPTAATVADAVWDEATADHAVAGSYGAWVTGLVAAVWASATRTLTAWLGGAKVCTITVQDGDTDAIGSCPYILRNSGGQTLQAGTTHSSTGVFVVNVDEANDYSVTLGPLANYSFSGNPYDMDVGSAASQAFTLTGAELTAPAAPDSPSLCRCYIDMRRVEGGTLLGVGEGSINVAKVKSRPDDSTEIYAYDVAAASTDADGRAYIDVVREAVVIIQAIGPGSVSTSAEVTVPDLGEYDIGNDLKLW